MAQSGASGQDFRGGRCLSAEGMGHPHAARTWASCRTSGGSYDGVLAFGAADLATLAVLGIVRDGFGAFSQVASAAKALARPDWQPTDDVLVRAVESALSDGFLTVKDHGGRPPGPRFAITRAGTGRLRALLCAPVENGRGAVRRTVAALKICFLGALDHESACEILEELSVAYRADLEAMQHARRVCPAARGAPGRWIDREIDRVEHELAWLARLQVDLQTKTTRK